MGGAGQFNGWIFGSPAIETNWVAIGRYNANGSVDPSFRVQNAPRVSFDSSQIRQLLVQPDGRILFVAAIYQRGQLTSVLDRALVGRLLSDGTWDEGFQLLTCALPLMRENGPFWFNDPSNVPIVIKFPPEGIPAGVEPPVPAAFLALQPDDTIVLAGAFDLVNGEPRRRLARLDPIGALRGRLELNLSNDALLQLGVPGEVEIPYLIETSTDLKLWLPWQTNAYPWRPFAHSVPANDSARFFRARPAE